MISQTTFCSAQAATILWARTGPMPSTSRRRSGSASITSKRAPALDEAREGFLGRRCRSWLWSRLLTTDPRDVAGWSMGRRGEGLRLGLGWASGGSGAATRPVTARRGAERASRMGLRGWRDGRQARDGPRSGSLSVLEKIPMGRVAIAHRGPRDVAGWSMVSVPVARSECACGVGRYRTALGACVGEVLVDAAAYDAGSPNLRAVLYPSILERAGAKRRT
jgi:hypothetical protein